MTYCQQSHFDTCLRTVFCVCARCGISLCQQHNYFLRGECLCWDCYERIGGMEPLACDICGKQIVHETEELFRCDKCRRSVCKNHLVVDNSACDEDSPAQFPRADGNDDEIKLCTYCSAQVSTTPNQLILI